MRRGGFPLFLLGVRGPHTGRRMDIRNRAPPFEENESGTEGEPSRPLTIPYSDPIRQRQAKAESARRRRAARKAERLGRPVEADVAVDAGSLALAEAAVGLWERSLSSATVEPQNNRLAGLNPSMMALAGRSLAVSGNLVLAIQLDGAQVKLTPAADFDVTGGADPGSWRYRLNLPGPSATETVVVEAAGVVHFRTGASADAPWRGVAPLRRAVGTAALAEAVEFSLTRESKLPPGRLVGLGTTPDQTKVAAENLKKGGLSSVASGTSGNQSERAWQPAKIGPAPEASFTALRADIGHEIANAFGVPAALFVSRGDGSGQREAWRRFWAGTAAPLARMIEAECKVKLDPACTVSLEALRASDEDGRSRAVSRRASAFKTLRDAGVDAGEARRLSGL